MNNSQQEEHQLVLDVLGVVNQVFQEFNAIFQEGGSSGNMLQVLANGFEEVGGQQLFERGERLEEVVQEFIELMRSEEVLESVAEFSNSIVEFSGIEFLEAGHGFQHFVEGVLHISGEVVSESLEGIEDVLHEVNQRLGQEFNKSFENVFEEFSKLVGFGGFHAVGSFSGVFGVHVTLLFLDVRSGSDLKYRGFP